MGHGSRGPPMADLNADLKADLQAGGGKGELPTSYQTLRIGVGITRTAPAEA